MDHINVQLMSVYYLMDLFVGGAISVQQLDIWVLSAPCLCISGSVNGVNAKSDAIHMSALASNLLM